MNTMMVPRAQYDQLKERGKIKQTPHGEMCFGARIFVNEPLPTVKGIRNER